MAQQLYGITVSTLAQTCQGLVIDTDTVPNVAQAENEIKGACASVNNQLRSKGVNVDALTGVSDNEQDNDLYRFARGAALYRCIYLMLIHRDRGGPVAESYKAVWDEYKVDLAAAMSTINPAGPSDLFEGVSPPNGESEFAVNLTTIQGKIITGGL
jgi:hypothetical protein